jgi:thiamine kinase-like enzyme
MLSYTGKGGFAMSETLIRSIFNTDADDRKPLPKGLTNKNTLIHVDGQWYVLREPYPDADKIVDVRHEAKALELISPLHLDVPSVYYDPVTGIKVSTYIEELKTYNECDDADKIERTARLMKKLHNLNLPSGYRFDPIARFNRYKSNVKTPLHDLSFAHAILNDLSNLPMHYTLCHNDWVPGNIGFTDKRDYLLDYEYAGDNDPLFDVMSFLTENNIEDASSRKRFYIEYFGKLPDQKTKHALSVYEKFHNLLWCTWAMMMFESRGDEIYRMIADDKYKALKMNFEK